MGKAARRHRVPAAVCPNSSGCGCAGGSPAPERGLRSVTRDPPAPPCPCKRPSAPACWPGSAAGNRACRERPGRRCCSHRAQPRVVGDCECENQKDNTMIYLLFSFFSQCFTLLEDKKDAGKRDNVFWAGMPLLRGGQGPREGEDHTRAGLLVSPASRTHVPRTAAFQRGSKCSQCKAVPAGHPLSPGGAKGTPGHAQLPLGPILSLPAADVAWLYAAIISGDQGDIPAAVCALDPADQSSRSPVLPELLAPGAAQPGQPRRQQLCSFLVPFQILSSLW